ncbi:hypothetical protein AAHZ94_30475 [Streptomyces sp. HSW2009]|uniref:hypothetical protein n=1 Tax=Streptomyces sp. HSW2009 TaxID=3142890 RepID=UPI0032EF7128
MRVRQTWWYGLRRTLRKRRRAAALGLVATAAVTAAVAPGPSGEHGTRPTAPPRDTAAPPHPSDAAQATHGPHDWRPATATRSAPSTGRPRLGPPPGELRAAPVRIADPGVARLLRRGDLVDVLAIAPAPNWTGQPAAGPAPLSAVPGPSAPPPADRPGDLDDRHTTGGEGDGAQDGPRVIARAARVVEVPKPRDAAPEEGGLVVLSVPRETATALVGAGITTRLAVVRR